MRGNSQGGADSAPAQRPTCGTAAPAAPCDRSAPHRIGSTCGAILTVRQHSRASRDVQARAFLLRVERWLLAQMDQPPSAAK